MVSAVIVRSYILIYVCCAVKYAHICSSGYESEQ